MLKRYGSSSILVAAIVVGWVPFVQAQTLRIYHIDVDQGDATLCVSPGGHTLLVDSGKNGHGPRIKAVMEQAGVSSIDHFVATHYHEDHYGGIDELDSVRSSQSGESTTVEIGITCPVRSRLSHSMVLTWASRWGAALEKVLCSFHRTTRRGQVRACSEHPHRDRHLRAAPARNGLCWVGAATIEEENE